MVLSRSKTWLNATKLTPPPMYDPVIIPVTLPKFGIAFFSNPKARKAPSTVPSEPMVKSRSILPDSLKIFLIFDLNKSIGIESGIA